MLNSNSVYGSRYRKSGVRKKTDDELRAKRRNVPFTYKSGQSLTQYGLLPCRFPRVQLKRETVL